MQEGVFAFRSYGMEDGLGNLAIFAIRQDAEGFLWAGTEDGLYRYDGRRFTLVRNGLRSNIIWSIATSPTGGLWVSTDEGAYRLSGSGLAPVEGLPKQRPGFLALGPGGSALAAQGSQLYGRTGGEPMRVVKTFPEQIAEGWASADLQAILVLTENHLWRMENRAWSSEELPSAYHGTAGRVFRDGKGRIYLRNRSSLWRKDAWDAPWTDLSDRLPGNAFNPYAPVEDALGRIWVGTSRGLACFDGETSWVLDEAKGLPGGWAGVTFVDREGSLWVGSEGVHKLKGRFLWTNFGVHQGLPAPSVWDIGSDASGQVYACTDSGVAVLKAGKWSVLPGTEGRTLLAGGGNGTDSLWFGGSAKNEPYNILFRLDLRARRLEKISIRPCLTTNLVLSIASAPGGVYIGTRYGGVFQVSRDKGAWKTVPLPFPDQAPSERINQLRKDLDGRLWAAGEHGLFVLENGRWTRLGPGDGLLGTNCSSLARDTRNGMWVSFLDARGISRLGRVNGQWRSVENLVKPDALFRDAISSLDFDHRNVLWMATGGGMKRWDGTNLEVFGRGDGLVSQDPSANGISVEDDNGLWQGFSNGISHFSPRAFSGTPAPPRARILEISDASRSHGPEEAAAVIPYKHRTLTFRFSALSFLNESKVVHEVRLVGLENEWRETQLTEARYPALPDGDYRFEVRSRFEEGPPGPAVGFSFRVLPPWWGTWWFRLLSLVAAGGAIALVLRIRMARLSSRNAYLERMVAHRTEALEASKAELELANLALEEASLVDPLTGLHNRRFLDLSLPTDAAQAQRALREILEAGQDPLERKEDVLVFLMDIDHFKTVNDTYGHLAGDQVLSQLAGILRANTRATDSLVRWGGEEFLLVARRARRLGAAAIAQNLLEAVRAHVFQLPEGVSLHKTWSIGFSALPFHPQSPELGDWQQALRMADQCLYAAKRSGRDRFVGAFVPPGADPAPFQGLRSWDVAWALERGLIDLACSEPDFTWPD